MTFSSFRRLPMCDPEDFALSNEPGCLTRIHAAWGLLAPGHVDQPYYYDPRRPPVCLSSHDRPSIFLSCAWRLTKGSVPGRLPEMSNYYCHPGRAGGLPVWANAVKVAARVEDSDTPEKRKRKRDKAISQPSKPSSKTCLFSTGPG